MKQLFNGWILARKYRYKNKDKFDPIGKIYPDGSLTGYIYVYPTKKCAELDLYKLKRFKNIEIRKVQVGVTR